MIKPRTGQAPPPLTRAQFGERFRQSFYDPAFLAAEDAVARLEEIAWDGYKQDRKAPITESWTSTSVAPGQRVPLRAGLLRGGVGIATTQRAGLTLPSKSSRRREETLISH